MAIGKTPSVYQDFDQLRITVEKLTETVLELVEMLQLELTDSVGNRKITLEVTRSTIFRMLDSMEAQRCVSAMQVQNIKSLLRKRIEKLGD